MTKMYQDLKQRFWWPGMKKQVAEYVASCLMCQKAKVEHQKPAGLLKPLDVPQWKWDNISMDFVGALPKTQRKFDSIWVIVDRLTKSAHFIPVRTNYVEALGTKLRLSSAYHPQTDGQTERTIQTLEDMLRACVLDDWGSWDKLLPLVEFTYNNSYHDGESTLVGPELVQQTTEKVRLIQERMKTAQSRQRSYADQRRRLLEFQEGDHVFLRVIPTTGVGRALKSKKLTPKFIGPYQILKRVGPVAYEIALPPKLSNLYSVFHVSQLRRYMSDPSHIIAPDDIQLKENLSFEVPPISIGEKSTKLLRGREIPLVKVIWNPKTGDATWEREDQMKKLYPNLFETS
ncbi:retrotransposon-related protein [Trifolium pratense]|uniref:Retrotransposon-related protein n=1 Tax=Trifolium pratense TaxID=57577 RepID=A0A2K3MGE4_TRIPR|nr:retrotransposon-related protein [Trifolium pratense]